MKHQEMKWTTGDGLEIFAQAWEPEVLQPKAVVCHVHEIGEHSSRYAHVAEAFGKSGFVFFTSDLRGHGRSEGLRGHIDSSEDFMGDIVILLEQARGRYPGLPVFLYGQSLGGVLVLYYSLTRKPNMKGVIATSTALRTALEKQKLKLLAVNALGSLMPRMLIPSGLDTRWLSRDPAVAQAYRADPLVHDQASLGFGKAMLGVVSRTLSRAAEFHLPLLLLHGKRDEIAFPSGSMDFAASLNEERCTLVLWEDGYHELHNDLEKDEVLKTMTLWMDARLHE
jgi:acylglycerol lipase